MMMELGFNSCLADTDAGIHTAKKSRGYKYWKYVLIQTDDLIVISNCDSLFMKVFEQAYTLKKYAKKGNK